MGVSSAGVREVKSAARTIELLEFLAAWYGTATRLRDVVEGLGTPRSSAYALLQTLVARGWVETDPTGADYSIGIRALLAGTSYIDRDPYVRLVQPILIDAAHGLRETMHMGRLDGTQIVYLLTVESHEYRRSNHRVAVYMAGKLKTAAQMAAIALLLYDGALWSLNARWWGTLLLWAAAVLTIWSMAYYLQRSVPEIRKRALQNGQYKNT